MRKEDKLGVNRTRQINHNKLESEPEPEPDECL